MKNQISRAVFSVILLCGLSAPFSAPAAGFRPLLVGISECCATNTRVSVGTTYPDALAEAGHSSLLICRSVDTNALRRAVRPLDLVIITGGEDVDPWRYGEKPSPMLGKVNAPRDEYDFALIAACRLENKPLLGICRGHQAINVAFGGTLVQDIPSEYRPAAGVKKNLHRKPKGAKEYPLHEVAFTPGSRLAAAFGAEKFIANSYHHQCVKRPAAGFKIVARSPDGVVEAIEHETLPVYGVQFHPEKKATSKREAKDRYQEFFRRLSNLLN